jgi:hypothetical protein
MRPTGKMLRLQAVLVMVLCKTMKRKRMDHENEECRGTRTSNYFDFI